MANLDRPRLMKALAFVTSLLILGVFAGAAAPSTSLTKPVADAGIYTGAAAARSLAFFVSPGGRSLRDIAVSLTDLGCAPVGNGANDTTFVIPKTAIALRGSFSAKGTQSGVFSGYQARFDYSFAGRFSKATKLHTGTAAGTFREDIRFTDKAGVHQTCTTNRKTWTATRSGPKLKALVAAGNYTGLAGQRPLSFAATSGRVNTIVVSLTDLGCLPQGNGANDTTFAIPQAALTREGSFSARASNTGVFGGGTATFTYAFSGHFQGLNSSGVGSAAGVYREDITYTDTKGVHQMCTTNTKPWTAARSS
jgi:hypothetical protein